MAGDGEPADDEIVIAQISFFLIKENFPLDDLIDPEATIEQNLDYQVHDFEVEGVACRFIYFRTFNPKVAPPWLHLINDKLPDDDKIDFGATSDAPNGILLLTVEGRVLAATFGRSAQSCLNDKAVEPDFGIKTAMNLCGNEEIRQTKTQNNAIALTNIDRQISKPSDSFVFGLSEAEDLRYISAHIKGKNNVTLQGKDSITLKVIGDQKLNWERIIEYCELFISKYGCEDYIDLFPNYRNFKPASEADVEQLNAELIRALRDKEFDRIQIAIPEFISDDEFSFSYSNRPKTKNMVYAFLEPRQLEKEIPNFDEVTIDVLERKFIFAYSHESNKILPHKKWRIFNCLVFEYELDKKYFILSDGRWLQVEQKFYDDIIEFIANRVNEEAPEQAYCNINIADIAASQNKESIFNVEVVNSNNSSILFDRAKLKIGTGTSNKEFCDILDMKDGIVRIINVKQYGDASSINYLFAQAKFYCEAFLHDEMFLSEIRAHINKSDRPVKDVLLEYIKETVDKVRGNDYRLCLWLLYDNKRPAPNKNDIPLMSKYELKLMHDHLKKICKFDDIILRFIPVAKNQFTKAWKKAA